ncbi:uncharacterized protein AB675_8574 [Cyphellophora attinorum]|uniref:ER transporter 6TM N-terminal domain-containing protein n=1 Tax=Cyphellophora attinorum TaxID=1664694 RepID=A0A0N1HZV3_9EURO|nr:uncharacterized protein AB675_8574 [Phialophora attinorum]KPI44474.1 hypothetical protein AB675_8574 [Phialophora attinorum]
MADSQQQPSLAKRSNIAIRLWKKLDIAPVMLLLAAKGALPATIALAAYQGKGWAEIYTTLGYLVAIIGTLSLCFQPRAKYLQMLITNVFAACLGAALVLLQVRCVVSARASHPAGSTGQSGAPEAPIYDTSANTTSAVFLMFWVYLANTFKSARPQLMISMIQFSIFVVVGSIYAPNFPTMEAGLIFVRRLLITFLTGYALATAVSLFIIPTTSRGIVTMQMGGFTKLLGGCLQAHGNYMRSVRNTIDFKGEASPEEKAAAGQLKGLLGKTNELMGKMKLELTFARREMAFGKLRPEHYSKIFADLRAVFLPVNGMTTFLGIVTSLREHTVTYADDPSLKEALAVVKRLEADEWEEVIAISKDAYADYQKALLAGLKHAALQLEFEKRPKVKGNADIEKDADQIPAPGTMTFARHLEDELSKFAEHRVAIIQDWAKAKNLNIPKHFWRNVVERPGITRMKTTMAREKINQHQLYMMLYLNFLNIAVGRAILKLVRTADGLVEDGTMKKRRFIFPSWTRIRELFSAAVLPQDAQTLATDDNGGNNIYLAMPSRKRKIRSTFRQQTSTRKRPITSEKYQPFSAPATPSLEFALPLQRSQSTRPFFLEQRGLWALVMVAISMDPHAGQGVFGFVLRIAGTVVAMVASIAIWYACDHKAAAIIPVFWVYMTCWNAVLLKRMDLSMISMISSITVILIIGYELQVHVIGLKAATSNGQAFYSIALLAVYRLTAVCAGLFAAFVWTYCPYPITTHGALRKDVGSTLYILANYYSCVHTTMDARLHLGPAASGLPPSHPISKLDAARLKVFGKVLLMINRLHTHSKFIAFEPPFGGKFPRKAYADLISSMERIFAYISLIEYSSNAYIRTADEIRLSRAPTETGTAASTSISNAVTPEASHEQAPAADKDILEKNDKDSHSSQDTAGGTAPQSQYASSPEAEEAWLRSFRHFAASTFQRVTSHSLTSTLCLLSAAIKDGQPLPPYFKPPKPLASTAFPDMIDQGGRKVKTVSREGREEEEDLLDIQHVSHPAFAAFAVGEVASAFVSAELRRVVREVRGLVGEVDFSFHVVGTEHDDEEGEGKPKWWEAMEGKEKHA